MALFERLSEMGHEQVVFFNDPTCGLKAIIAIHDTTLGPSLGGTRMWPYKNEEEALTDVLRLSKGMTYKASISGLDLGGGKAVIIGDPAKDKSEAFFRSYGRFVESLNGRYITAEDVNISVADIEHVYAETNYVVGVSKDHGGSGNPAPYTALGVFRGIEACCYKTFNSRLLQGKVVAVQGAGSVGRELIKLLSNGGARIIFTDINPEHVEWVKNNFPQAEYINPKEIHRANCDIYAPCALGAVINDETITEIKCKIVAGAANNQLKEDRHGVELKKRGILYAPDYLINAGGLMNVSIEFGGWSDSKSKAMVDTIYDTMLNVFKIADEQNLPLNKAADALAEKRIQDMKKIKSAQKRPSPPCSPGRNRF